MTKISSYLGFCIRARKIVFGVDRIETQNRGYLLIADGDLKENSLKIMIKASERMSCRLLITDGGLLGELLHRGGVKAVVITEKQLAHAIEKEAESKPQIKFYSGGQN